MSYILSVEDDPLQSEWLRQILSERFPTIGLRQISTEYEFGNRFEEIATDPPKVILLDMMLRWTDPAPSMPKRPPEVREGGLTQAGRRCEQRLQADPRTSSVPIIFYTVLEREDVGDLPANVVHVEKDADPAELIRVITPMLQTPQRRH